MLLGDDPNILFYFFLSGFLLKLEYEVAFSLQAMVFPVVMYGCESWTVKKVEHRRIDVFELWCWRRLESPLDCKEIQPIHPKGNQSWIFIGRTDAEAETPILWPPDAKNQFIGKDPDGGKDWRQEEKGTTEDEMVGWHHQCNGHEFERAPEVDDGQGSLVCWSPWGHKESDLTERLTLTERWRRICGHLINGAEQNEGTGSFMEIKIRKLQKFPLCPS